MQKIHYIGEHLLIGKIGNIFVLLSFIGALLAAVCYFLAEKNELEKQSWIKTARIAFRLHSLGVIGIIVTLFTMILNHYYEYYYVWEHSNNIMPMRYVLSCFWEGQEGSFLLWTFWQVVIGNILIYTAKNWESSVMTVIALVQTFLASMLLGLYFHGIHIGSNPFTSLLRDNPQFANIPLFQNANYLKQLDGRGLNPLLQNYWMTIHPPTLFLGFASTVVPFAFAIAGLWRKKLGEWQAQALPWVFFGVMVLGTGILMGGAWAYESLSFGGFWGWDPVENAALVPWLVLVAAGHILIIYKNKKQSLLSTYLLPILTFVLTVYATFLTRSGILGKTSVHSFPDLGLSGQLLIYLLFFVWLSALLLMQNKNLRFYYTVASAFLLAVGFTFNFSVHTFNVKIIALFLFAIITVVLVLIGLAKHFPKETEEEAIWSREFWMFIGALVLLVSCFQIMTTTSIPVTNKLFHMNKAEPANRIEHYNMWQVPFAFLITLLIGVGQYFKYKNTDMKSFVKKISPAFFLALAFALSAIWYLHLTNVFYAALLFSATFAVLANLNYFIRILGGKVKKAGPSIAHIGFALIVLGALVSTSKQRVISANTSGKSVISLGKGFSDNSNILMTVGDTLKMGNYYVTYTGKDKKGVNIKYHVKYFTKENGQYKLAFTLNPVIQLNPQMGNVAEPSTKRFLTRDIYTHITFADLDDINAPVSTGEFNDPKKNTVAIGDTMFSSNAMIVLDSIDTHVDKKKYDLSDSDIVLGAKLKIYDFNKKIYYAEPLYIIKNGYLQVSDTTVQKLGLKFSFVNVNTDTGKIDITIAEKKSVAKDYIVMTAIIFPFINILWMGCIIMVIGTIIAIRARLKSNKLKK